MPWFYYSGNIPRSVEVKKGVSVAMRPHSKVEIKDVSLQSVQVMVRKGLLRRSGRDPSVASVIATVHPVKAEDIVKATPKPHMAVNVAEKGVTSGPGMAPKSVKGAELTNGEKGLDDDSKPLVKADEKPAENIDKSADSGETKKSVDEDVEVLSNVAGSSDKKGRKKNKKYAAK